MIILEVIIYILVYIFLVPILAFIHELAHAFVALLFSDSKVSITLGNGDKNINCNIGRLTFNFKGYKSMIGIMVGYVECDVKEGYRAILLYLAGPIISLIITIYLYLILKYDSYDMIFIIQMILNALFNYSFGIFITSIIPMKYYFKPNHDSKSDGYNVIIQLKKLKANK